MTEQQDTRQLAIAGEAAAAEAAAADTAFFDAKKCLLAGMIGHGRSMRTDLAKMILLKLPNPEIVAMNGQPLTAEMRSQCSTDMGSDTGGY